MPLDLEALIRAAGMLEPLPATATRLASIVARPDAPIEELEDAIRLDPALTARLLRAANSAAGASRVPIQTVRAAVVRLGTGAVLSIAVGSVLRGRTRRAIPQYGLGEGALWRHSVAAALTAESAARLGRVPLPPGSFAAALLHDIGKLLLSRFLDPPMAAAVDEALARPGASRLEAELEVLGVHHGEVGGVIARRWGLPDGIAEGITHHHDPESCPHPDEEVAVICHAAWLGNVVARRAEASGSGAASPDPALEPRLARLGLAVADLEGLARTVRERIEEVSARYA